MRVFGAVFVAAIFVFTIEAHPYRRERAKSKESENCHIEEGVSCEPDECCSQWTNASSGAIFSFCKAFGQMHDFCDMENDTRFCPCAEGFECSGQFDSNDNHEEEDEEREGDGKTDHNDDDDNDDGDGDDGKKNKRKHLISRWHGKKGGEGDANESDLGGHGKDKRKQLGRWRSRKVGDEEDDDDESDGGERERDGHDDEEEEGDDGDDESRRPKSLKKKADDKRDKREHPSRRPPGDKKGRDKKGRKSSKGKGTNEKKEGEGKHLKAKHRKHIKGKKRPNVGMCIPIKTTTASETE